MLYPFPKIPRSKLLRIGGVLVFVLLLFFLLSQYAAHVMKNEIVAALGPESEIASISVGLGNVEIKGLTIHAKNGEEGKPRRAPWPSAEYLRAERIVIRPALLSLLSSEIRCHSVLIEKAYLSVLRAHNGKMRILPTLTEKKTDSPEKENGAPPRLFIGEIRLVDSALDFFDATVRQPALKLRVEPLNARVESLRPLELTGMSALNVEGTLKGERSAKAEQTNANDGAFQVQGKMELASKESDLKIRMSGVRLAVLQDYLRDAANMGIQRGTLSLDMHSVVKNGQLNAPGTVVLKNLRLSGAPVLGQAQNAALSAIQDDKGEIRIPFVLSGNVDSPSFSLNKSIVTHIGGAITEKLSGGLKSVGELGKKSVDAVSNLFSSDSNSKPKKKR
ncbi:MAG: DUF748 domain-containing protein [Zoogloeaceae bacterium]|jgi:hypothetical protein|nr:DUF748 domain-containing protein [Zoogloeaceae bacterium]